VPEFSTTWVIPLIFIELCFLNRVRFGLSFVSKDTLSITQCLLRKIMAFEEILITGLFPKSMWLRKSKKGWDDFPG
jgi:hypothetical protein